MRIKAPRILMPGSTLVEHLAGDGAGRHAARRLARRRTPAAAIVAQAVFGLIGVVRVAGAKLRGDGAVVFRALIDVLDHQRNRRAGRHLRASLRMREDARQDFDFVGFASLRRIARLTGTPLVEEALDVGLGQRHAGWTPIDHAADRWPVALTPGRHAKQMAEAIVGHDDLEALAPSTRAAPPSYPTVPPRGNAPDSACRFGNLIGPGKYSRTPGSDRRSASP